MHGSVDNNKITKIELFLLKKNIQYKNIALYRKAFTHTSYVHETNDDSIDSYERLEFLGDAILGKTIAVYLYENYSDLEPGDLSLMRSNIVCKSSLAKLGKRFELEKLAFFGRGEINKTPSDSIYEDMVESLIGAIYLDLGEEVTKKFIIKLFKPIIIAIDLNALKDFKTQLQEELQSEKRKTVKYRTIDKNNDKNEKMFFSQVLLDNLVLGEGFSTSKKKAEQKAAQNALEKKAAKEGSEDVS